MDIWFLSKEPSELSSHFLLFELLVYLFEDKFEHYDLPFDKYYIFAP
jgi:hypothetical protein